MSYKWQFNIKTQTIHKVFLFAETLWKRKAQSYKDFGSTLNREKNDFIADTVEGKIAEEGFLLFLKNNFNLELKPDYEIYENIHENDFGNDLQFYLYENNEQIGLFKVDLKSARHYSQWLLVEKHKSWANMYVLATISGLNQDWEKNPYNSITNNFIVTIAGFAYYTDLIDQMTKKPWFTFHQGDSLISGNDACRIINTLKLNNQLTPDKVSNLINIEIKNGKIKPLNVNLKAKVNYGLPCKLLRKQKKEWLKAIEIIKKASLSPYNKIIG